MNLLLNYAMVIVKNLTKSLTLTKTLAQLTEITNIQKVKRKDIDNLS